MVVVETMALTILHRRTAHDHQPSRAPNLQPPEGQRREAAEAMVHRLALASGPEQQQEAQPGMGLATTTAVEHPRLSVAGSVIVSGLSNERKSVKGRGRETGSARESEVGRDRDSALQAPPSLALQVGMAPAATPVAPLGAGGSQAPAETLHHLPAAAMRVPALVERAGGD